jgi:hypothetical protein
VDWDNEPRLGKMPDLELARICGCTRRNVAAARKVRGINSWKDDPVTEDALDECIGRALANRFEAKNLSEVFVFVLNDYGQVSMRTVRRRLTDMVQRGTMEATWDGCYLPVTKKI